MDRIYKGCRVNGHADDYCVVDLETTGIFVRSAKIIEISAVRVRSNQITDRYSRLVNPGCPIPPEASAVNHISDEMVKDCPCLEEVIDSFAEFVGDDVIMGYNNAGFDMNLLYAVINCLQFIIASQRYLYTRKICILPYNFRQFFGSFRTGCPMKEPFFDIMNNHIPKMRQEREEHE